LEKGRKEKEGGDGGEGKGRDEDRRGEKVRTRSKNPGYNPEFVTASRQYA